MKLLSKQKAEELVAKIKEPLPAKECVCCEYSVILNFNLLRELHSTFIILLQIFTC